MARRTATINKNQERAVIIGAGITEKWYYFVIACLLSNFGF